MDVKRKNNKKLLLGLIVIFAVLLGTTLFVSFSSNTDVQEVIVKSITPVYDESSTVVVDNENVVFNDKNQVVDYKVVIENTQDYDVKISDITLSTPTEEFLQYEIEDITEDDVLAANSTKELTVSFETMGIKGWGRNFNDELTANISFEKVAKQEEVIPPVEEDKEEEKQPEAPATNTEELISKTGKIEIIRATKDTIEFKETNKLENGDKIAVWLYSKPIFLGYFDVVEKDGIKQIVGLEEVLKKAEIEAGEHNVVLVSEKKEIIGYINVYVNENKELLMEKPQDSTSNEETPKEEDKTTEEESKEETDNKDESTKDEEEKIENPYTSDKKLVGILGIATCITGVAIIIVSKNKLTKYTVFILMLSPALTITNAEEVIEVAIKNNVSFESQNVMKKATTLNEYDESVFIDYWLYRMNIKNIYIQNEISEISEYEYRYDVTESGSSRVIAYLVKDDSSCYYDDWLEETLCMYDLYLQADGIIYPNEDASYYFEDMRDLESIDNLEGIDTSNVTDMSHMFEYTGCNSENFNLDVSNFDTSNVTNMSYMFKNIGLKSETFFLDLSNFDTSKVTNMRGMFGNIGEGNKNITLDLSNFDTSNVTDMIDMFQYINSRINDLNITLTISNSNTQHEGMFSFSKSAPQLGGKVQLNYTNKTKGLVNKIVNKYQNLVNNLVLGEMIEVVGEELSIGDEIYIGNEYFNVISQTDDTVTMLAMYNLGTDYRQTLEQNNVSFADSNGWEYTPGPKEIDIQTWTTNPKTYVNAYVEYLKTELGDDSVTGDLITLNELKGFGCIIGEDMPCWYSSYQTWLVNGQSWWTRSADSDDSYGVWYMSDYALYTISYEDGSVGIRPVITITKEALKNYLKTS